MDIFDKDNNQIPVRPMDIFEIEAAEKEKGEKKKLIL